MNTESVTTKKKKNRQIFSEKYRQIKEVSDGKNFAKLIKRQIYLVIILLTFSFQSFSQERNILDLKKEKYYTEENNLKIDTLITLENFIKYDVPNSVDEEHQFLLKLLILDSARAFKEEIDVSRDTIVIKSNFYSMSSWELPSKNLTISGTIKILFINENKISAKINISILDKRDNSKYSYKGFRIFTKQKAISKS